MSDEAVVRIVLDDSGNPTSPPQAQAPPAPVPAPASRPASPSPPKPEPLKPLQVGLNYRSLDSLVSEAEAMRRGNALPWSPPGSPIAAPNLPGMGSGQADMLRMEAEAARGGFKDWRAFKKAEDTTKAAGTEVPPAKAPTQPTAPATTAVPPPPVQATPPPPPAPAPPPLQVPPPPVQVAPEAKAPPLPPPPPPAPVAPPPAEARPPLPSGPLALAPTDSDYGTTAATLAKGYHRRDPDSASAKGSAPLPAEVRDEDESTTAATMAKGFHRQLTDASFKPERPPRPGEFDVEAEEDVAPPPTTATVPASPSAPAPPAPASEEATVPPPDSYITDATRAAAREAAEKKRQEAEAEYAKSKEPPPPPPEPPFDPVELAKKRVKAEEQRQKVDAEYAKLKPKSATDRIFDVVNSLRGTLGAIGGPVVGAGLDLVSGVHKSAKDASEASAMGNSAGAAAAALGGVVAVAAAVVVGFKALTAAMDTAVERYGGYSYDVSSAQADVEMKKVMNDMRRAEEHGPELAKYVVAQGQMQEKWEEAKIKLLMDIAPALEVIMEVLGNVAEGLGTVVKLLNPVKAIGLSVSGLVQMKAEELLKDGEIEVPDPTRALFKGDPGAVLPEV